mgnify:CR=1 FL=1
MCSDALTSAFDSAGQRCSALRVLCLQDDIADTRDADAGKARWPSSASAIPTASSTDVGPVITDEAQKRLIDHIDAHARAGHVVHQAVAARRDATGTFVPPTLIEIDAIADLPGEVFGPVLHVLRYPRERHGDGGAVGQRHRLRPDLRRAQPHRRDRSSGRHAQRAAGNQYVNRNMIGAVVGVQPFGGHGLSGTGPKAGGPLYVHRAACRSDLRSMSGRLAGDLAGPVGERNVYALRPKGTILCVARDPEKLKAQHELRAGDRAIALPGTRPIRRSRPRSSRAAPKS